MSLHRFFLDDQVIADEALSAIQLRVGDDDVKHMRALRLTPGEHIAIIDAASDYFECEILSFEGDAPVVKIAKRGLDTQPKPKVILIQGIAKGDKMDTVIRQATELGVGVFVPFSSERSVVKLDDKKAIGRVKRWRSIAKSAAMQSGQLCIPDISSPKTLSELDKVLAAADACIIFWEEASSSPTIKQSLELQLNNSGKTDRSDISVVVVVGPEGGLTHEEVDHMRGLCNAADPVSLGDAILRTETAGVIGCALVLYELGYLGNNLSL